MSTVALLGDSVLDNFYWLKEKNHDLAYYLRQRDYKCNNFAVDEAQLADILKGQTPKVQYSNERKNIGMEDYPTAKDNKVYPIELLKNSSNDYAVLSVGGNDLRVSMPYLMFGTNFFINNVLNSNFVSLYEKTISEIVGVCPQLILVVVYIPCTESGIFSYIKSFAEPVFCEWRKFIYSMAKKFKLPVLDLSLTFDPNNRSHYGSTEIEPSNFTSEVIASGIDNIISNWKESTVYYKPKCEGEWITKKIE